LSSAWVKDRADALRHELDATRVCAVALGDGKKVSVLALGQGALVDARFAVLKAGDAAAISVTPLHSLAHDLALALGVLRVHIGINFRRTRVVRVAALDCSSSQKRSETILPRLASGRPTTCRFGVRGRREQPDFAGQQVAHEPRMLIRSHFLQQHRGDIWIHRAMNETDSKVAEGEQCRPGSLVLKEMLMGGAHPKWVATACFISPRDAVIGTAMASMTLSEHPGTG